MNTANDTGAVPGWAFYSSLELDSLFSWCRTEQGVDRLLCVASVGREGHRRVVRPEIEARLSSLFEGQIVTSFLAGAWPGTRLVGHRARVTIVRFDSRVARRVVDAGPLLWDWTHANPASLPEDLCLFRQGAEMPAFFSVTHEGLSWVISGSIPPFGEPRPVGVARGALVPTGTFFCDTRVLRSIRS
jgi:hypothetical protein